VFYNHTVQLLQDRGVKLEAIAQVVHELQLPYNPSLTLEECLDSVKTVLKKREVQHAVITGIAIDILAEQKKLPEPFQTIMEIDEPLYGVDEILALSIVNVYGTIGLTSFGYLDKEKNGIISYLNNNKEKVNVFLDDLVAGIAAAASARIAHQNPDPHRYQTNHVPSDEENEN
jgi:phosphatidylglycerophosphatase A